MLFRSTVAERDTPRSKYLNAGPGLGGFGDNEAHGKILPCHRVREDGLMRINPTTVGFFAAFWSRGALSLVFRARS